MKIFVKVATITLFLCVVDYSISITSSELKDECSKIRQFRQKVDHFNIDLNSTEYFSHRFIYSNRSRNQAAQSSPIVFAISSSSDLTSTCEQNVRNR